jgi:transposase
VAEVRRLGESEEQRKLRLWWSYFRRCHQAGAKRCHWQRRDRQAPWKQPPALSPIRLAGVSELTDAQWEKIRLLLPKYGFQARRQVSEPRLIIEAILWVMRTGSSWREIPERFGPWSSVAERYYRWCRDGKWALILQVLQEQAVPLSSSA